jgi:hypothetical protein
MLNIFHARIASNARCHVSSPLPSWMRLWSTLYPSGAVVADAPTSVYENLESFRFEMKRRISSSLGPESLNKGIATLLRRCGLRRRSEAGRHPSEQNCEPVQCEKSDRGSGVGCIRPWRNSPMKYGVPTENSLPR